MTVSVKLGSLIEKSHIKYADFVANEELEVFGVSNVDGITRTSHRKSDDLGGYLVIEPNSFAYNPYRINVGSIGLTPDGLTGLVSPAYVVFKANDSIIPEILLDFLKSKEGLRQINKLAHGGVRKALRFDQLCEIEFPKISYEQQIAIMESKRRFDQLHNCISLEIATQEKYLPKLRQEILISAIQGKLTSAWRNSNSSSNSSQELLIKIAEQRANRDKSKKKRIAKLLPEVKSNEIPFPVPDSWTWCRFGSYADFERGKFSARPRNDARYFGGKYPFIQIGSLDKFGSVISSSPQTLNEEGLSVSKMFEAGTIAIAIVGGTIGNLGVLGRDMCFTDSVVGVRPNSLTCQDFILLMLLCKQTEIQAVAYQRAGQPNISLPNLTDILIPLPPLEEQFAIVDKVNELMNACKAIESEIGNSKTAIKHLASCFFQEAIKHQ